MDLLKLVFNLRKYYDFMLKPIITKLNFTYKRNDSDLWILNTDDIPIDKNIIKDQQIVHFAPKSFGGNHKHPRTEWFVGIGDLEFIWIDENGKRFNIHMNPNEQILLIEVPAFLPHAVINKSDSKIGLLFELANAKMSDVEEVKIVK